MADRQRRVAVAVFVLALLAWQRARPTCDLIAEPGSFRLGTHDNLHRNLTDERIPDYGQRFLRRDRNFLLPNGLMICAAPIGAKA